MFVCVCLLVYTKFEMVLMLGSSKPGNGGEGGGPKGYDTYIYICIVYACVI